MSTPSRGLAPELAHAAGQDGARRFGVVLGRVWAIDGAGNALVSIAEDANTARAPVPALRTVPADRLAPGVQVLLMHVDGDPARPVITGVLDDALSTTNEALDLRAETITITAGKRLILRCGDATITLGADGRLVSRAVAILSRALGANIMRGGTIKLN